MRSRFWIAVEGVIAMGAMFFFWVFGFNVGIRGAMEIDYIIVPEPTSLLRTLYGVVELFTGIAFFIMLGRQTIPGGMKELLLMEVPLAKKDTILSCHPRSWAHCRIDFGCSIDFYAARNVFVQHSMINPRCHLEGFSLQRREETYRKLRDLCFSAVQGLWQVAGFRMKVKVPSYSGTFC